MSDKATAIPVPDNWDDLTDAEKDRATADLLKAVGDRMGVRQAGTAKGESPSRPARQFRKPS